MPSYILDHYIVEDQKAWNIHYATFAQVLTTNALWRSHLNGKDQADLSKIGLRRDEAKIAREAGQKELF